MKQYVQLLLAGVITFSLAPSLVHAQDPDKNDKPAEMKDDGDAEPSGTNLGSKADFDIICQDAGIAGEQLDKIHDLAGKRIERLKAWINGEDGRKYLELRQKLTAARRERAAQMRKTQSATQPTDYDATIKQLTSEYRPLAQQLAELRTSTRGDVLKEFTPEQQEKAVSASLNRRIARAFDPAKLTDDQQQKVKGIVDEAAKEYLQRTPLDQDPLMRKLLGVQNTAAKRIRQEVLTDEQREALKQDKKSEPTTQKD